VRQAAVQELARGWKDDPETLPLLKQLAQSDDNWAVRRAAVQELARGWKDDPETLPLLKQLAQSDDNWDVRYAAVQELARGWKDEPGYLNGCAILLSIILLNASTTSKIIPEKQHLKSCSSNTPIAQKL
jgi:hypothetical protein